MCVGPGGGRVCAAVAGSSGQSKLEKHDIIPRQPRPSLRKQRVKHLGLTTGKQHSTTASSGRTHGHILQIHRESLERSSGVWSEDWEGRPVRPGEWRMDGEAAVSVEWDSGDGGLAQ